MVANILALPALDRAGELAELARNLLSSAAIVAGGAWTYIHYFRGRTFHERLEIAVSGTVRTVAATGMLEVRLTAKNVGLSKVPLPQRGSGLRIFVLDLDALGAAHGAREHAQDAPWHRVGTFDVLTAHAWIEPGEALQTQALVILPKASIYAVRAEAVLVSRRHEWSAQCVITIPDRGGTDDW